MLVTSLKTPDFSLNLLDKLIVLMEDENVDIIICITKRDLLTSSELEEIDEELMYYKKLGYTVIDNTEIQRVKRIT